MILHFSTFLFIILLTYFSKLGILVLGATNYNIFDLKCKKKQIKKLLTDQRSNDMI